MLKHLFLRLTVFLLMIGTAASSSASPLNLSDWDAWGPVSISADGLSATLSEDTFGPTSLENPALTISDDATILTFDYRLTVASGNEDYFDFYFDDITMPIFSTGGLNEDGTDAFFSGSYSLSLDGLQGGQTAIIFALQWGWDDYGYDSTLVISNVDIATQSVNAIPEPATVILFAIGLVGWAAVRRQRSAVPPCSRV